MSVTRLKKPIRRVLDSTDRDGRPYIVTLFPNGAIEVAPRRLKPKSITVGAVYRAAVMKRVLAKTPPKKRRVLVKRGIL